MKERSRNLGLLAVLLALGALALLTSRSSDRGVALPSSRSGPAGPGPSAREGQRAAGATAGERAPSAAHPVVARPEAGSRPQADPKAAERDPALVVTGTVLDLGGNPIEGAEILAGDPWGEERPLARSDASGAFRGELAGRPEALAFTALADGHEGARKFLRDPRGEELRLGRFRLAPGGEVGGRVVDEAGEPLARAWVEWLPASAFPSDPVAARREGPAYEDHDQSRFHACVRTTANGRFRMRGLPRGEGFLSATAEGWSYAWSPILAVGTGALAEQEIVLRPSDTADSAIEGVVLDPSGAPAAGIEIVLGTGPQRFTCASTGRDGRFLLDRDWRAAVGLAAHDPEERWADARLEGVRPGTRDVVLRLGEPEWLVVRLVDADARPIPWGHLRRAGRLRAAGQSGVVRLVRPREPFELQGSAPGYATRTFGPFDPQALGEELSLALVPGQALRGRVLHRGRPVAGARLDLAPTPEPGSVREARGVAPSDHPFLVTGSVELGGQDGTSDGRGGFVLTIHGDGWHGLRVEAQGFPTTVFGPYSLARAQDPPALELELERGGALEGRVLLAPGAEPRERLVAVSNGWNFVRTAAIGPDGRYRIEDLAPGPYQVRPCEPPVASLQALGLGARASEPLAWDCRVGAGETTRFDLDLTGEGSVVLAGELVLVGARPERWRALLLAPDAPEGSEARARAALDGEGRFELCLSRAGTYRLEVHAGLLVVSETVELYAGRAEWRRRFETGRLRLRVPGAAELEAEHAGLRYVAAETGSTRCMSAELDAYWTVDSALDVPVGKGRLERRAANAASSEWELFRELSIAAGEELVVDYP